MRNLHFLSNILIVESIRKVISQVKVIYQWIGPMFIFFLISSGLKAQDITMDIGGPTHSGVYQTLPLQKFRKVAWKTEIKGNGQQNCLLKNGVLYVSSVLFDQETKNRTGFIYAVEAKNGKIIWENSVPHSISSPTLKDSVLYYGSDEIDGKQIAVNAKDGKIVWEFKTKLASCYPPAIIGNKSFFGSHGNRWYVIDNGTGQIIKERESGTGICCSPSVLDSIVFFVDWKGILHAYNANTLLDVWTFNSGNKSLSAPALVDQVAYLVTSDGTLFAIDIKTGQLKWSIKTDDTLYRSPAVKDSVATLISSNGHIYAFNTLDGSVLWDLKKTGLGYTHTAIVDNLVYVGCADNCLYALDLKTGKERWKFKAEHPVNTPLIDNKVVYFTSGKYIYALK